MLPVADWHLKSSVSKGSSSTELKKSEQFSESQSSWPGSSWEWAETPASLLLIYLQLDTESQLSELCLVLLTTIHVSMSPFLSLLIHLCHAQRVGIKNDTVSIILPTLLASSLWRSYIRYTTEYNVAYHQPWCLIIQEHGYILYIQSNWNVYMYTKYVYCL